MDDFIIRVMTMPDTVDGKPVVTTKIDVMDKKDKVIRSIDSKELEAKAFNNEIYKLAEEYGLRECVIHKTNVRKKSL